MPYCPDCGTEHEPVDAYCSECGEPVGRGTDDRETSGGSTAAPADTDGEGGWNWLDPRGPFRSPRNALNTVNTVGIILLVVGLGLSIAGVDSPFAVLPDPLPIVLLIYILVVIFVGIPIWFVLLLTDNVLGFLRTG